jgi:hypothetical protein
MVDRDDNPFAWLALMSRLNARRVQDEDPDGGRIALSSVEAVLAVAGVLKHHQERAANDAETAELALLLLWLLYIAYANTVANLAWRRANRLGWPGDAPDVEGPGAARVSHACPALPTESRAVTIPVQFLKRQAAL